MSKMVTMDVFKLSQNLKFKYRDKRELEDLRGMCGHIVHLRIRMKTCLKLACFCPKLTKTVDKIFKSNKYQILHVILHANYA